MDEMDEPVFSRRSLAKLFLFYALATGAAVVLVWVQMVRGDDRITLERACKVAAIPLVFALVARYLFLTSRCVVLFLGKQCRVTAEPGSRYCHAHRHRALAD